MVSLLGLTFLLAGATYCLAEEGTCAADRFWECGMDEEAARAWVPRDESTDAGDQMLESAKDAREASQCEGIGTVLSPILPVDSALAAPRTAGVHFVFIMRAGENEGVFARYKPGCHLQAAVGAARALGASFQDTRRPLRLLSASARTLGGHDDARSAPFDGLLHVYLEGEVWVWPGIRVGLRWRASGGLEFETLSLSPRVLLVRNVTNRKDAKALVHAGKGLLRRSPEKHYAEGFENYRTSQTAMLPESLPAAARIREVTHRITLLPSIGHIESPQLLRYDSSKKPGGFGQWYKEHQDYFHKTKTSGSNHALRWLDRALQRVAGDEKAEGDVQLRVCAALSDAISNDDPSGLWVGVELGEDMAEWLAGNVRRKSHGLLRALLKAQPDALSAAQRAWTSITGKVLGDDEDADQPRFVEPNRHATTLVFLNDVPEGGETVFPKAVGRKQSDDQVVVRPGMPECSRGLLVRPLAFAAVLFYNKHGNGTNDPKSKHGGCPPMQGRKFAINSWAWNVPTDQGISYHFDP